MKQKALGLVHEAFQDRFIRKAAKMLNFVHLAAVSHDFDEAVHFLDELRRSLAHPQAPTKPRESRFP